MEDILKRLSRRCDCANYIGGVKCQCCAAANEIESLRATISRLREYARHKPGCWWLIGPNCDCGYDALMAELEGSK